MLFTNEKTPDAGRGPDAPHAGATHTETSTRQDAKSDTESTPPVSMADDWNRRRAATKRLAPAACGCRDPWLCRCRRGGRRSR